MSPLQTFCRYRVCVCFFVDRGKIIVCGQQVGGVDCTLKYYPVLLRSMDTFFWTPTVSEIAVAISMQVVEMF